ncbi:hypothetical protein H4R20_001931 [Coemansia guatemalensis]|uniref:L domain-like protein n=1 Tax=Coemansia guatemalensis TaxID=2761395 RepID=A0A9W8LU34_9FUNG|nr:hypothetical protein H4R20_001931 [Coemansia guatemalensis]
MTFFASRIRRANRGQWTATSDNLIIGLSSPHASQGPDCKDEAVPSGVGANTDTGTSAAASSAGQLVSGTQSTFPQDIVSALRISAAAEAVGAGSKGAALEDLQASGMSLLHKDNDVITAAAARSQEEDACLSPKDITKGAVDLSCRHLICVLPGIAMFARGITRINLSYNALTSLPDAIGHLRLLQQVDISHNQLESLPMTIAYWQDLHTLNASSNCLVDLPTSIRHLRQLCIVNLSRNRLETVPSGLWRMCNMSSLDLSNNPIRVLPARMFALDGTAAPNSPRQDILVLDGCPLGQGFTDSLHRPSLVLSGRFKHATATLDGADLAQPKRPAFPTLADIILCTLANSSISFPRDLPDHIQASLRDLRICDHCYKLYPAATGVKRWRLLYRKKGVWPIEYNFCTPHWSSEKERIASLFASRSLQCTQPYHEPRRAAADLVRSKLALPTQATRRQRPMSALNSVRRHSLPVPTHQHYHGVYSDAPDFSTAKPLSKGRLRRFLSIRKPHRNHISDAAATDGRRRQLATIFPKRPTSQLGTCPSSSQLVSIWHFLEDDIPHLPELPIHCRAKCC